MTKRKIKLTAILTALIISFSAVKYMNINVYAREEPVIINHLQATVLTLTKVARTHIRLTWTSVKNAETYTVMKRVDGGKAAVASKSTNLSYNLKSLRRGHKYEFTIIANAEGYKSSTSNTVSYSPSKIVLKTPIPRLSKTSDTSVRLTWKKIYHAGSYIIFRKIDNGKWRCLKEVKTSSYIQKSLPRAHKFYYKLKAKPPYGNMAYKTSIFSRSVKTAVKLKAPVIKRFRVSKHAKVKIIWRKISKAKKYAVYRSAHKKYGYKKIKVQKSLKINTVLPSYNQKYYYKVKAIGAKTAFNAMGKPKKIFAKVKGTRLRRIENYNVNSFVVRWRRASGCDGYALYRSSSKKSGYKRLATLKRAGKLSYFDSGLSHGKKYYYKIKTYCRLSGKIYYSKFSTAKSLKVASFYWPVPGYKIRSSSYGWRIHPITGKRQFHEGVDIPCPVNTPIKAALGGTVTFAGTDGIYGRKIVIRSAGGIVTKYCHNSVLKVYAGEHISRGQIIALAGTSGRSTGVHCHFETWVYGICRNPNTFFYW